MAALGSTLFSTAPTTLFRRSFTLSFALFLVAHGSEVF